MNHKISPALVCGFAAAVLTIIPGLKSFACCLIIPFAVYMSLIINQKINGLHKIVASEGVYHGLLTGLFAAVFGTLLEVVITFVTKSNDVVITYPEFEKYVQTLPSAGMFKESLQMIRGMIYEISTKGFSILYTTFLLMGNVFVDTIFGIIGGLVAMSIINRKNISK
jgi:hypothetical protein